MLRLLRMPVTVTWETPPDPRKPHIIVANHASYSDGIVIGSALAEPHCFVAKAELARAPVLGHYLRALRTVFIERFAAEQSLAEVGRIRDALCGGDSVIIFPEGTFTRARVRSPLRRQCACAMQLAHTSCVTVTSRTQPADAFTIRSDLPHEERTSTSVGA